MPVTGLNHYNLRASRPMLDRLYDFYVNIVGLQTGYRPPFKSFGYWLYAGKQAVLHLTEADPDEERSANVTHTFDHAAFTCTNAPAVERHLADAQVSYTRRYVPLIEQLQLFVVDPAGNGVELNFAQTEI